MRALADLEAENERLRQELDRLRAASRAQLQGTMISGASASTATIGGLEEMTLLVDGSDDVHFVNPPMARLLGMPDRKAALGTPLSRWDSGPMGAGVLATLVDVARASGQLHVLERSCPGLGLERLPDGSGPRPVGDPMLRLSASCAAGRVQIVAQDVTRLRWLERTFSRFVSRTVIDRMQSIDPARLLAAERRELTVIFGDLRGFTALAQDQEPEVIRELVNGFLEEMVGCIEALDGTVDAFLGDGFMALFGAPVEQRDHALRALVCAAEMQRRHRGWMAARERQGLPVRPLGLGVGTGPLLVGNIGTQERLHYTVIGHAANLTARLCGAAGPGEILTTPTTHRCALEAVPHYGGRLAVPRFRFQPRGELELKNVDGPTAVLAVEIVAG